MSYDKIEDIEQLEERLKTLADPKFRAFHIRLIPNIDPNTVLGIRMPVLRKEAAALSKAGKQDLILTNTAPAFYEEKLIHALLINKEKEFDRTLSLMEEFLPQIDCWAVCDALCCPALAKDPDRLLEHIHIWIRLDRPYTVRFAILMLMKHFLGTQYDPAHLDLVIWVDVNDYYVRMMQAWYLATAAVDHARDVFVLLEQGRIRDDFVHNKTIQKMVESFRISDEQKVRAKALKRAVSKKAPNA